jgi:hypothetical protein
MTPIEDIYRLPAVVFLISVKRGVEGWAVN